MTHWLVPSPLLQLISRRVSLGKKSFVPAQLMDATTIRTLTPAERDRVAFLVVDRIERNGMYMAALRKVQLGPLFQLAGPAALDKLTPESQTVLKGASNLAFEQLPDMHWGQVLSTNWGNVSRAQLITALAEVEWRNAESRAAAPGTPGITDQITQLLRDPRIDEVLDTDLRYSWRHLERKGSLVKLLGELRSREANEAERRYVDKLWRGFQFTLAQDIESIAQELASRTLSQTAARMRAADVFAMRFGARQHSTSREAIAKQYGVTMSWISMTLQRVIRARGEATLMSPAASRLLRQMRENQFLPVLMLEEKLGLGPGAGDSLVTFRRFLTAVVHPSPALDSASGVHTQAADVLKKERKGVSTGTITTRHHALVRAAKRQFRAAGAVSVTYLAGVVALEGATVNRAEIERMVEELPGALWLDRDAGWFVLNDDLGESLVYGRVRKILAVAQKPVSIREIGEVLYRDIQLAGETEGEFPLAPLRILKLAMLTWPGVEEPVRPGFLADRRQTPPADVLAPQELVLYETLAARGGIGPTDAVAREADPNNVDSMRSRLLGAPFAYTPVSGVSALRGWRITREDLLAVLAESALAGQPERAGATLMVIRPN